MKFKFGSWNLQNRRKITPAHIEFLKRQDLHLLAAQEVSEEFHAALKSNLFEWGKSQLELLPPGSSEGRRDRLSVSIFGRAPFQFGSVTRLSELRFPRRALAVETTSPSGCLTVCSFHIPPGASWGKTKTEAGAAIVKWLCAQQGRLIFGIDANSPIVDHPDPEKIELWPKDCPQLVQTPSHGLQDAFRVFLKNDQASFDEIRKARPSGPLAISHYYGRGSREQKKPCRYDYIFVSKDITVGKVEYINTFESNLSDHALVVGSFDF